MATGLYATYIWYLPLHISPNPFARYLA